MVIGQLALPAKDQNTHGWNCLWRGHSVYRNRPLIPKTHQGVVPDPLSFEFLIQPSHFPNKFHIDHTEVIVHIGALEFCRDKILI